MEANKPSWEYEKDGRELKVRIDGQLTFSCLSQRLTACLAGFGPRLCP